MTEQEIAKSLIEEGEGIRLLVYDDATGKEVKAGDTLVGHPSIGYGRNLAARGISQDEANELLRRDLYIATKAAKGFAGHSWHFQSPAQRAVLIDMAHQLGAAGLSKFKKMQAAFFAQNYDRAADEMLDSRWARQTPNRAERNSRIMRKGDVE